MKSIIIALCLFASFAAPAQIVYFLPVSSGGGGTTPPAGVQNSYYINFGDQFVDTTSYPSDNIQFINYAGNNNAFSRQWIKDTTGTHQGITLSWPSGSTTAATGAPDGGSDPSSDNVWCRQLVAGKAIRFSPGAVLTFSGLPASKSVRVWIHSNAFAWEATTATFTVNSVTTSSINSANNAGTCGANFRTSSVLRLASSTTTSGGVLTITCNTSDSYATINAIYIEISN